MKVRYFTLIILLLTGIIEKNFAFNNTPKDSLITKNKNSNFSFEDEIIKDAKDSINIDLNVGFNVSTPSSNEKININKISDTHYSINLAKGTMPATKDFVLKFMPIISTEPYVQIYAEDVGDDMNAVGNEEKKDTLQKTNNPNLKGRKKSDMQKTTDYSILCLRPSCNERVNANMYS